MSISKNQPIGKQAKNWTGKNTSESQTKPVIIATSLLIRKTKNQNSMISHPLICEILKVWRYQVLAKMCTNKSFHVQSFFNPPGSVKAAWWVSISCDLLNNVLRLKNKLAVWVQDSCKGVSCLPLWWGVWLGPCSLPLLSITRDCTTH